MKEHQLNHKHSRYYIYRHSNKGTTLEYWHSTGYFADAFTDAVLYDDLKFAQKKAKSIAKRTADYMQKNSAHVCVGKVNVEIDGYFMPIEVK
jgi:hypothetical protein